MLGGPLSLRWAVHTSGCIHPSGWNGPRCFHAHLPTELFPVLAQRFFGRSPCFFFYKYHVRDKISTIFPERIIRPCVLAALCAVEPQGFYYGGTGESELGRHFFVHCREGADLLRNNTNYLLSFEMSDGQPLLIHGDPEGLKRLAQLLLSLAENTPEGYFDHEHLWMGQELSLDGKGGKRINDIKVYCWRGHKAYGDPDYSSIDKPPKSLSEHGYSLTAVKEWRTRQSNDGLPSSFDDFLQEHSLCVECRATGITFQDRSARLCTVCGGSGRTERSEP